MAKNKVKTKKTKSPARRIKDNRLKAIMEEKGIIIQEIADMVGVNQSLMSLVVNNKRQNISLRLAWDISEALDMKIEDVFIKD